MGLKLLIADDEDTIRNGMFRYIQLHTDRFEKIYLAENGEKALDIIMRFRPDIVLLDVQMPYRTGIDVMKEMDRVGIKIPVIILSGYDEFEYARQALILGTKDYLLKPCRSSEILARIHEIADEFYGRQQEMEEVSTTDNPFVSRATDYIKEHYFEYINLESVAENVGISSGYLSTLFTSNLGVSFVDYLNGIRIEHACTYLRQNFLKTYEVAYKVGFKDEKYFSKVFKKMKNVSPSEYRRQKPEEYGEEIVK